MKILVLNGPNLNMIGIREPAIYGEETYEDLCKRIRYHCTNEKIEVEIFQSNHEGDIIDKIQSAYDKYDGLIVNMAAYSHTSIAIMDALKAINIPSVDVHISDITKREEYRHHTYISEACFDHVIGEGTDGYIKAINILKAKLLEQK